MARRNSSDYAVVWPRSAKAVEIKPLAKRLDTIDGKTIAFLWDDLFRGDEIWPILKEELSSASSGVNFIDHDAFGSTHGEEEHRVLGRAGGEDQVDEDRRGRLRHGLLRKLHTRRVAGQRDCRTGRRAHLLAVLRGLPGTGQDDVRGVGLSQPRARDRAGPCRRADVGGAAGQRARHDGRSRDPQSHRRDRRGAGRRRSRSAGDRVRGQLRGGQSPLPGERLERRPADRAADQGEDRRVPGLHRSAARPCDRQAVARQPARHGLERRGQRRDGRLPAGIHADPGRARRGDGRSAVRRRAFRQHAGGGDPDRAERAADQAARLQLRAGRVARWLPAQHLDRPLLAPLPAQRGGLPAAPERQGYVRQHLARGAGGERGQPGEDEVAHGRGRHGRAGRPRARSRSRASPAATSSSRCSATVRRSCCPISAMRS